MKKWFLIIFYFLFIIPYFLKANRLHNAIVLPVTGNGPRTCASGDMNNDGYDDIVIACMKEKKIIILYGNSVKGIFSSSTIITPRSNLNVDVGDIDKNGLLDIAFTEKQSGGTSHIGIYYQDYLNHFTNLIYSNYGDRPIKIADANNDGKLDLCSFQDYRKQISPTNFSARNSYSNSDWSTPSGNMPGYYFDIVDINNDGKNDILTFGSGSPSIHITFPGTTISEETINTPYCYDFITADVNNDGLKDFILSYFTGGASYPLRVAVDIYLQTSLLNFQREKSISVLNDYSPGFDMSSPAPDRILFISGDFNNDTLTDIAFILTQRYNYKYLYVLYQQNDNTFDTPMIYEIPDTNNSPPAFFGISSGDFNGDNLEDIVITDYTDNLVYVFYQNSTLSRIDYIYPAKNEMINTLTPSIKFKGYDDDNDSLKYKIELYQDDKLLRIYNQTETTQGWNKAEYHSGEEVIFQIPSSDQLEESKTYKLKIYAYDGLEWSNPKELTFSTTLIGKEKTTKNFILTLNQDGKNEEINFNLSSDTQIIIYDTQGKVVYKGNGSIRWNGRDNSGKMLPSGIYFYQIKKDNKYYTGTITLVR